MTCLGIVGIKPTTLRLAQCSGELRLFQWRTTSKTLPSGRGARCYRGEQFYPAGYTKSLNFMTDNTTIIGTFGTLVAASSLVINQVQEFDIYLKFGISCIGLLTAILTAVYVGLKLWHGTYKKE